MCEASTQQTKTENCITAPLFNCIFIEAEALSLHMKRNSQHISFFTKKVSVLTSAIHFSAYHHYYPLLFQKCWVDTITWIYICEVISHIGTICKVLEVLRVWAGFWLIHVFAEPITIQPFNQLNVRSYKTILVQFSLLSSSDRKFGTDIKSKQIRRNFRSQNPALSLLTSPIFFLQMNFSNVKDDPHKCPERKNEGVWLHKPNPTRSADVLWKTLTGQGISYVLAWATLPLDRFINFHNEPKGFWRHHTPRGPEGDLRS